MKVQKEDLSTLERKLTINIPSDDVDKEFNRAFRYLQKNVTLKGFRKGKAPLQKIKALYQNDVNEDVSQNLIQNHFFQALQKESLFPVDQPNIDITSQVAQGEAFEFTAQFEVRPDVKVENIEGLKVEKRKLQIEDKVVDESLENRRAQKATYEPIEGGGPVENGHFAEIDFEGMMDNSPLPNGSAKNHLLEIGSSSFIEGFEEGLIGLNKGEEKTLNLKFPDEYQQDELQGKDVTFKVKVNEIKKKVLPEWTDEFVKSLGNYENFDALKKATREELEKAAQQKIESELKSDLFKSLVTANPFDAPKSMIKKQQEALVTDLQQRMAQQGMNPSQFSEYQEKWDDDFKETAEHMVKSALLIQKIAEDHKLQADKSDIDKKIESMAADFGIDKSMVEGFYKSEDQQSQLQYQLTEDKVFEFLLSKAEVTEVEEKSEAPSA